MSEDKVKKDMEKGKDISELPPKQLAYHLLRENGLKTQEAAKSLDYKKNTAYHLNSKLKKYSFTGNTKAQKTAHKTISSLAAGKVPQGSDISEVKDNTAFQASKYISDHNDPVVNINQNLNINVDISPVDMSKYRNKD